MRMLENEAADRRRNAWRALFRLAHGLRYRVLPELIGRRVTIASLETVESSLRGLAAPWLAEDAALQHRECMEGALCKYGLIDAQLDAPRDLLAHGTTFAGLDAMRACGFLPQRGERWGSDVASCAAGFVQDLANALRPEGCVLKLMLNDGLSVKEHTALLREVAKQRGSLRGELRLPAGYLPREMTVTDACASNAGRVWIWKHFYL